MNTDSAKTPDDGSQNGNPGNSLGAVALVLLVLISAGGLAYYRWFHPSVVLGPEQPIAFSHRLHFDDKQIDCYYCHSYPARSIHAGIPTVQKCLGCHSYIIPGHPEIRKLRGYAERQEPIPWVRVYYNPDHVYFPHFRHIGKNIACNTCHRDVESRDRLSVHTFTMGFCLDCHDRRNASRECVGCHQ